MLKVFLLLLCTGRAKLQFCVSIPNILQSLNHRGSSHYIRSSPTTNIVIISWSKGMERTSSRMQTPAKTQPSSESTHPSKSYGCITGSVHLAGPLPSLQDELPPGGYTQGLPMAQSLLFGRLAQAFLTYKNCCFSGLT